MSLEIIKTPHVTEKSSTAMEKGRYVFVVSGTTNKIEVKKAFEKAFGEKVATVQMVNVRAKTRLAGKGTTIEKRHAFKKAIVTLVGKKKIDIFQTKTDKSDKDKAKANAAAAKKSPTTEKTAAPTSTPTKKPAKKAVKTAAKK